MSCCCVKTLNLCNVGICGIFELDEIAINESGAGNIYTLVLDFMETTISLAQEQTPGENIKFNVGGLNENFQYTGQVFNPLGQVVPFVVGNDTYDCIKFKTIIKQSIS